MSHSDVAKARREKLARARARNRDIAWTNPSDTGICQSLSDAIAATALKKQVPVDQLATAVNLPTDQAEERITSGKFEDLPVRSLLRCLTDLGFNVQLSIMPKRAGKGSLTFARKMRRPTLAELINNTYVPER